MSFSPDNSVLAVHNGTSTVWNLRVRPSKTLANWERYWVEGLTFAFAFSPDSRTLASATEFRLTLRDPATGTIRKEWQFPGAIRWVSYAPDGRHLVTINSNGTGYILRLAPPDAKANGK
jgi:WD40 repeat protein